MSARADTRHRAPREPRAPHALRSVELDQLPRQPRYSGNYEADVERLMATLSPETRRAVDGVWRLGGRELTPTTLLKVAAATEANADCILLWCGYARIARGRYRPAGGPVTVLIDRYDTETLAVFRLFQRHWPDFQSRAVLTGASV